jgi:hypothetical protein
MSDAPAPGGARRAAKPRRGALPRRPRSDRPTPRRPRSDRPGSRRPGGDRTSVVALALLALVAIAVALTSGPDASGRPEATQVGELVDHAVLACPAADAPGSMTSRFAVGVVGAPGLGSGGAIRQGPQTDSGSELDLTRGRLVDLDGTSASPVLTGSGQLAAGLLGIRVDTSQRDATRATTPCVEPGAGWWFTGAGAGLDHASQLTLSNVDAGPAVVDLRVLGPDGPVDAVNTRGITIAPGDQRTIPLSDVAPQTDELSLGVTASRGRVLAAVSDGFAPRLGAAQGREWLRGDVTPSRRVRLAGLPGKADARTLLVANPSDSEAVVDVEVAGSGGRFVPAGLKTQTVPPGAVASIDLDKSIGKGEPTALRLRSQVPVLGSVRTVLGGDTTYAPQVLPLTGPAAAPVVAGATSTVQLTAGAQKASAEVVAYDERGNEVATTTLKVPATATAGWSPRKKGAAYLVVTPLTGSVNGAVVYQGGGVATYPLSPLPIRLDQPLVNPAVG